MKLVDRASKQRSRLESFLKNDSASDTAWSAARRALNEEQRALMQSEFIYITMNFTVVVDTTHYKIQKVSHKHWERYCLNS